MGREGKKGGRQAVIENRSKIRDAAFLSNLPESWSWNDKVVGVAFATMAEGGEGGRGMVMIRYNLDRFFK